MPRSILNISSNRLSYGLRVTYSVKNISFGCAYPNKANGATYIGRLEYSNVLRVVNQI